VFALSRRQRGKEFRKKIGFPIADAKDRHDLYGAHHPLGAAFRSIRISNQQFFFIRTSAFAARSSTARCD
jgi:hypothetical protein